MPKSRRGRKYSIAKKRSPPTSAASQKVATAAPGRAVPQQQPVAAAPRKVTPKASLATASLKYPYVARDLIRVGVVTGIVIVLLVVFALILS